jgi:hypothetical protein
MIKYSRQRMFRNQCTLRYSRHSCDLYLQHMLYVLPISSNSSSHRLVNSRKFITLPQSPDEHALSVALIIPYH